MKAILFGVVTAALVAVGAAYVLDTEVQETAAVAFTTSAVRL